ncbi:hypothetical protein CVS40_0093 [Lucilia cuprina]|nr:hypothetical protein CVS40_0093 [Lucilia cuprina]
MLGSFTLLHIQQNIPRRQNFFLYPLTSEKALHTSSNSSSTQTRREPFWIFFISAAVVFAACSFSILCSHTTSNIQKYNVNDELLQNAPNNYFSAYFATKTLFGFVYKILKIIIQ